MRAKTAKMPATVPTAAPLASLVAFSVISALASAISSRTSSEARSETSWTARPSSDVVWSSGMSVHQPLEDAGKDEGAGEGGADEDLRPFGAGLRRGRVRGRGARPGAAPGGLALAALRGVGLLALALGDALRLLGLLARLLLLAGQLLGALLRLPGLLLGLGGLLLGAARVGGRQLAAQLGAAGLGTLALRLGVVVRGHSGGSSPNMRR